MDSLLVDARYQSLFARLGLSTPALVRAFLGEIPAGNRRQVLVVPKSISVADHEVVHVFYKQYYYPKPSWRFWSRPSKARREYDSYAVFEGLGLPCAERIACGEQRDRLGRLRHAFILTRAIPQTVTLLEFALKCPLDQNPQSRVARTALANQIARMVRRLHEASFFHNDLYWRNNLVQWPEGELPRVWWIDCPRGGFAGSSFTCRRRQVKDLAALDLEAVRHCSRTERIRFLRAYLDSTTLDRRGKKLARDILSYRQRRWAQ